MIRPKKTINAKYLYHFFRTRFFRDSIKKAVQGANIANLKNEYIDNLLIYIPETLDDQIRIATVLTRAEKLIAKRKESINALDEFLKSTFLEMFGDPVRNEKGWEVQPLGNLAEKITDGTHKTPRYVLEGIKFISAKNIKNQKISWSELKYITPKEHDEISKRCNPEKGDILLTKSGSLGMAALVEVDFSFSLFESLALIKIKNDYIHPVFIREYLNLDSIKQFYIRRTKGVGVKHLHLVDIKSLPILVPQMRDQMKFIKLVKKVETLKTKTTQSRTELENLYGCLSQRAFKGELDLSKAPVD